MFAILCYYFFLVFLGWTSARVFQRLGRGLDPNVPKRKALAHILPSLPGLGHALGVRKAGVALFAASQQKVGDVVELRLGWQRTHLWLDPPLIRQFYEAPDTQITFKPAVEQFTQRVFGLPSKFFFPRHSRLLQDLRDMLVPTAMPRHAVALGVAVARRLDAHLPLGVQSDLYVAMRRIMFGAGVEVVFGKATLTAQTGPWTEAALEQAFHDFEAGFELAASPLPHFLQPRWCRARDQLLAWLRDAHGRGLLQGSLAANLVYKSGLMNDLAPNLLLTLLWASLANTVAAAFWAVAFLLLPENSATAQAVVAELESVTGAEQMMASAADGAVVGGGAAAGMAARATIRALDRRSSVARAVGESVRLRVQSIDVRFAAAAFTITTSAGRKVVVPKGTLLMLSPYLSHLDPRVYKDDPLAFNPGRNPPDFGPHTIIPPATAGLAFGAGFYRCPGRVFAEMEVAVVAQVLLAQRSMVLTAHPSAAVPPPPWQRTRVRGLAYTLEEAARTVLGDDCVSWGAGLDIDVPDAPQGVDVNTARAGRRGHWLLHAGDPNGLLPPPDLSRLVGVKVPSAAAWVGVNPGPLLQ